MVGTMIVKRMRIETLEQRMLLVLANLNYCWLNYSDEEVDTGFVDPEYDKEFYQEFLGRANVDNDLNFYPENEFWEKFEKLANITGLNSPIVRVEGWTIGDEVIIQFSRTWFENVLGLVRTNRIYWNVHIEQKNLNDFVSNVRKYCC